jgi:hypothetical protein
MLHEVISTLPSNESTFEEIPHSDWVYYPRERVRRIEKETEELLDRFPEERRFASDQMTRELDGLGANQREERATSHPGHSLFQELFFFCTVKKVGDLPGAGCIYVETVVDSDSGLAFAKIYSGKNALNAVDILTSRVLPYFERLGEPVKEIHTRKTTEYCGMIAAHPYETFLATSQIRHLPMERPGQPHNYICEEFYRHLLKEFFPVALRRTFQLSLNELQKQLDKFVGAYNAAQMKDENEMKSESQAPANFPVDL